MKAAELAQVSLADIAPDSQSSIEIALNLHDLEMRSQIRDSFDDLVARKQDRSGLLYELTKLRLLLRENGQLRLINTFTGELDSDYRSRAEILLVKAGFHDFQFSDNAGQLVIAAKRRPYLSELSRYNMTIREIVKPSDIQLCHNFARDFYYYKDYNYDVNLAQQFDLNTDSFAVFDKTDKILAIARCAARVPGYYCPFMYATDEQGEHINIPPEHKRFCEVMVLFQDGKYGAIAFRIIVEFLTAFFHTVAHYDTLWTTYDITDEYTGTYYKTRFYMTEYNRRLTYRDFGSRWNLIYTQRIKDLCDHRHFLFKSNSVEQ